METLDAPKPMIIEFKSKEIGMKDWLDYSNKVIQGRTKMLLWYSL